MAQKLELDKVEKTEQVEESDTTSSPETVEPELLPNPKEDIHEINEATMEETIQKLKQQQAEAEEWLARYRGPGSMAEEEIPRERQRIKEELAKAQETIKEMEKRQSMESPLLAAVEALKESTKELKQATKNLEAKASLLTPNKEKDKRFAWVKWFVLLVSGVALTIFSDIYFRVGGHNVGGVDPHSYDVVGTWMIGLALLGYFMDN